MVLNGTLQDKILQYISRQKGAIWSIQTHPPVCLMLVSWNFFLPCLALLWISSQLHCLIVAFGRPFHTLIILYIKKLGTFSPPLPKGWSGKRLMMTNLNLIMAGGQLIGKWKQPNTNLQECSDFMSNCHVKGSLAVGSMKPNSRPSLNMATAFLTYVPCLEV